MRYKFSTIFCLFLTSCSFVACSKKSVSSDGDKGTVVGSVKALKFYPGYKRVALSFVPDAVSVDYCEVSWGNPVQTKKLKMSEAKNDTLYTIIEAVEEGTRVFTVNMFDEKGTTVGITSRIQANVYGDKYVATLGKRSVSDLFFLEGKEPYIAWRNTTPNELFLEVNYDSETASGIKLISKGGELTTALTGYKQGTDIMYRSAFLPAANALDTLYSESIQIAAPSFYSSIANKYIVEKSGLVKSVIDQSSKFIHDDVMYSTLQFRKEDGQPISLFLISADFSSNNITMSTLMPNNNTAFGVQTVKAMAEHKTSAGQHVIAAVNADFFDGSPLGRPWGPVVLDGQLVKDYGKDETLSYIGVTKTGTLAMGRARDLTAYDYSTFQNLVGGGGNVLYNNGNRIVYNDSERHPRTMVGYTKDKQVYLIVVDGRRADHSVGMTIDELSLIMGSLGTVQATNLDGGGSSTMVLHEQSGYQVVNRVSGDTPRAVANGLAITIK